MGSEMCLRVENLTFGYGEKPVLRNLSLTVPAGKVTTVMGANGCGKSTLFQLMTKNRDPDRGEIFLGDRNLKDISLREFSRQVAIVHQNNTAPGDMTVGRLVSYGRVPFTNRGCEKTPPEKRRWLTSKKAWESSSFLV